MPSSADIAYYERRASEARQSALAAPTQTIAAIHEELARHYDEHVAILRSQPTTELRLVAL